MQNQINFCDILDQYGQQYIENNKVSGQQKGIINLLSACRTRGLGSHFEKCNHCNYLSKAHNSCRNRHCPVCQQKDKQKWLDQRMKEVLPVGYYHIVFTIPHQLNALCLQNKKVMYDILFRAASQTVLELAKDPRHLGADTGLITVLHTWGQNMMEHPHLHCIMPAGGLSFDKRHWVHPDKNNKFFIHYKVLSRKFRGKFLDLLQQAVLKNQLTFKGSLSGLSAKSRFSCFKDQLYKKEWVVNIQPPMGNPDKILEYLSRYVFRIAITNRRILEVNDGKILFSWKDYRTGLYRKMKLDTDEFIRRFLLHVLPSGFFKVRYYGIFASRYRKENLSTAKKCIAEEKHCYHQEAREDGRPVWEQNPFWKEIFSMIQSHEKPNCPKCKKGRMTFAGIVPHSHIVPG